MFDHPQPWIIPALISYQATSKLRMRGQSTVTTIGSGKYTYELISDWARLPEGQEFGMVSALASDSQDRVVRVPDAVRKKKEGRR